MFGEKKKRIVFHPVLFFPMCLPVTVSHSMTCQRGLEGSEQTTVSFSTLRGDEAPRARQRTSARTWRLLSVLHITALKGCTLKKQSIWVYQSEMFFFVFLFCFFFCILLVILTKLGMNAALMECKSLPEGLVWCREQITLELKTKQSALETANEYVLYCIMYRISS